MNTHVFSRGDVVVTPSGRLAKVVHYYHASKRELVPRVDLMYLDDNERCMLVAQLLKFHNGKYIDAQLPENTAHQDCLEFIQKHIPSSKYPPPPKIDWNANLAAMQGCISPPAKLPSGALHFEPRKKKKAREVEETQEASTQDL